MQKIRLLVHKSAVIDVLDAVQRVGAVEFTNVTHKHLTRNKPTEFELNYVSARLDLAVEFLSRYAQEKTGIAAMLEGTQERVDEERIACIVKEFRATEIADEAQSLQKELNDIIKKKKELAKERELLLPWRRVSFAIGSNLDTVYTKTVFVIRTGHTQTSDGKRSAHYALARACGKVHVPCHIVSVDKERAIVTWEKSFTDRMHDIFKAEGYESVQFEKNYGIPAEEIKRIDHAIKESDKAIKNLEVKARKLARHLPELKIVSDYTLWQKERHVLYVRAHRTNDVFVYEGWCPRDRVRALVKAVAQTSSLANVEKVTPHKDETPPVEIANDRLVQPFEMVTRLYGLPSHVDVDPTPYLAGFFLIFFGFCLTDFGYGVVLMLLTGFALWRYNVQKSTAIMLKLLFLGGLSSALAGLLFGGYFGVDMSMMPAFLQRLQQFDPIKDPLPVFYLALALGVAQVLFGLIVAIISKARRGNLVSGLLDNGPWLFFFVALGLFLAHKFGVIALPYASTIVWGAIASLVLTQGRTEKNIFMKLFKGVTSLYDIVAYFSDVLSYSRLLALGLATSALAFAVNMIAGMIAGDDPSVFSLIAAGIVLVIGHVFNLVVNTLGAFIHSARLQFVEFFGKFLTGTGRVFTPFRRTQRYTIFTE